MTNSGDNLLALEEHYEAKILVSRFTYAKGFLQSASKKPGTDKDSDHQDIWYDPRVMPYVKDGQIRLAPGIVWCGEMNILPTAVRPLSGMSTYTRGESMVIPHVKVAMESYGVKRGDSARFGYTSGTVTLRNYIQKKAGQKAEFHHVYGALLVEVDSEGCWWARQVVGDTDGKLRDVGLAVEDGMVSTSTVASITWGDIHVAQIDEDSANASWEGENSMAEVLEPETQVFHDVLDFLARNHHDTGDPHRAYEKFVNGNDSVEEEVMEACRWLEDRRNQGARLGRKHSHRVVQPR